jgi:hypothetical protein
MTPDKKRRLSTALGFLSGVLACMDAMRDASVFWPPDEVWAPMNRPHRLEFGGGILVIVVTLIVSIILRRAA